ncbi:MAG: hypothetical protein LBL60_01395 [Mycoplasmataceae bacterium]|nr:hypothetical protein [Mycoplasmataceae bacterium]
MNNKVSKTSWIKEMFKMFSIKKSVDDDNIQAARNAQYLTNFTWLLFLIGGALMLLGGIMCIATFNVGKTTSILLIVFGVVCALIGIANLLIWNNIKARIQVYKNQKETE